MLIRNVLGECVFDSAIPKYISFIFWSPKCQTKCATFIIKSISDEVVKVSFKESKKKAN